MNKFFLRFLLLAAFCGAAVTAHATEYVKICPNGTGLFLPGTDVCFDPTTGQASDAEALGNWMTFLPYSEGQWVATPQQACPTGQWMQVGTFKASDFTLSTGWNRYLTKPINFPLGANQFISKVIMSGGFSNPATPDPRHATNADDGLCVRSMDPSVMETNGSTVSNPPFGNGGLPVGCIANSRILNMPSAYAIEATAAYPNIDQYLDSTTGVVRGPYVYGKQLVITTDSLSGSATVTYTNPTTQAVLPTSGTLSVSVCVQQSATPFFFNPGN